MEERWGCGEEREARLERERRKKMEMKQRRESRGKRESLLGGVGVVVAMGMDGLAHLSEAEALSHGEIANFSF